jgi:hypothetical protein
VLAAVAAVSVLVKHLKKLSSRHEDDAADSGCRDHAVVSQSIALRGTAFQDALHILHSYVFVIVVTVFRRLLFSETRHGFHLSCTTFRLKNPKQAITYLSNMSHDYPLSNVTVLVLFFH